MIEEQPSLIIKRGDHYEVHYRKIVKFVSLNGELLGLSVVHPT